MIAEPQDTHGKMLMLTPETWYDRIILLAALEGALAEHGHDHQHVEDADGGLRDEGITWHIQLPAPATAKWNDYGRVRADFVVAHDERNPHGSTRRYPIYLAVLAVQAAPRSHADDRWSQDRVNCHWWLPAQGNPYLDDDQDGDWLTLEMAPHLNVALAREEEYAGDEGDG